MPRFEPLVVPLKRVPPRSPVPLGVGRAGAARVRLPFVKGVPLAGWGPFLQFGSRVAKKEDAARLLHARALVLEAPSGERVALVTIDLHGGSRYITEKAASLLADQGFHPANLYLCGTHNHAGPGGLYASPYFDGFAASTGIFSGFSLRVGFNQTLADVLAARVERAVRGAIETLRETRLGSSHQVRLGRWSRQRSADAVWANFPGASIQEVIERFKDIGGGEPGDGLARWAVDARVQTIAAFEAGMSGRLIGSFSTWGAHCSLLSREHEIQSADYFGEAATLAEARHPGAVVAVAAGAIGDADPLPPQLDWPDLLAHREYKELNFKLIEQQAQGLSSGLLEAIADASRHQAKLKDLSARLLEDPIAGAHIDGAQLPLLPQVGIPTLAGSEMGTGDIAVLGLVVQLREGVRQPGPDNGDPHWPRTQSNWDDPIAWWLRRLVGQVAASIAFRVSRPFLEVQHGELPVRYLELKLEDRTLSLLGLPGEPTTWLAAQLGRMTPAGDRTIVAGVTGDYCGYLTTEAEYASQQYEGSSTIWGRHTERWLSSKVKLLVSGQGSELSLKDPEFTVLREQWITRVEGESGTMTRK